MGTIVPRPQKDGTTRYRAQIRIMQKGKIVCNESRTFSKQAMAKAWMAKREKELEQPGALDKSKHGGVSIGTMLQAYADEVSDGFGRTKKEHIKQLAGMPLANEPALGITSARLIQHIQWRKGQGAGPSTIANDLVWLRVVYRYAKAAWGWPVNLEAIEDANTAARAARLIAKSAKRTRRPTPEELEKLSVYFQRKKREHKSSPPMHIVLWFAIYSCRRLGEIISIRREDLHKDSGTYLVRDMKHPDGSAGNDKVALMGNQGWEVVDAWLAQSPGDTGLLFPYTADAISASFSRACKVLGIDDLRFHDLRHEACSRLAEDGATIPEIQQVSLHESWSSLSVYVNVRVQRQRRVNFTPSPSSPLLRPLPACPDTEPAH